YRAVIHTGTTSWQDLSRRPGGRRFFTGDAREGGCNAPVASHNCVREIQDRASGLRPSRSDLSTRLPHSGPASFVACEVVKESPAQVVHAHAGPGRLARPGPGEDE